MYITNKEYYKQYQNYLGTDGYAVEDAEDGVIQEEGEQYWIDWIRYSLPKQLSIEEKLELIRAWLPYFSPYLTERQDEVLDFIAISDPETPIEVLADGAEYKNIHSFSGMLNKIYSAFIAEATREHENWKPRLI